MSIETLTDMAMTTQQRLIKLGDKFDRAHDQVDALDREIDENTERLKKATEAGNQAFMYMLNMRLLTLEETRKMYAFFTIKVGHQVEEQVVQLEAVLQARQQTLLHNQ